MAITPSQPRDAMVAIFKNDLLAIQACLHAREILSQPGPLSFFGNLRTTLEIYPSDRYAVFEGGTSLVHIRLAREDTDASIPSRNNAAVILQALIVEPASFLSLVRSSGTAFRNLLYPSHLTLQNVLRAFLDFADCEAFKRGIKCLPG